MHAPQRFGINATCNLKGLSTSKKNQSNNFDFSFGMWCIKFDHFSLNVIHVLLNCAILVRIIKYQKIKITKSYFVQKIMFSLLFVVKTWHIYTYMIYVHVLVLTIWLSNIHSLQGLEKLCIKLCIYFSLKLVWIWSTVCFIHHTEKLKSCHILHFL